MSAQVMVGPAARERRHTLQFLHEIRSISPVFLGTEVDMTWVRAHRATANERGGRYSTITYLLHTVARVLIAHPEANAAIQGRIRPRIARNDTANGKITLDKTLNGHRVVLSAVLPGLEHMSLEDIQRAVNRLHDADPATTPEFAGARLLQRLPILPGRAVFRLGVRPLRRRPAALGTFAVTSLGHRPVDAFYSVGGTTITLGIGRTADRPAVRDGHLVIAPLMRLSLAFDHRVIDGAEAADVLAEIKEGLEDLSCVAGHQEPGPRPVTTIGDSR
jgi:pyruvate/2-oxoglutarate dehydrogenase complex dihydrolipoamide acyltransferase (E2) component